MSGLLDCISRGNAPPVLEGAAAAVVGGTLFVFGGREESGTISSVVYRLALASGEWLAPFTEATVKWFLGFVHFSIFFHFFFHFVLV